MTILAIFFLVAWSRQIWLVHLSLYNFLLALRHIMKSRFCWHFFKSSTDLPVISRSLCLFFEKGQINIESNWFNLLGRIILKLEEEIEQRRDFYMQHPIIRNGHIRNRAEFLGKFKKRALGRSNLRNASKNLRNGQRSDFQS